MNRCPLGGRAACRLFDPAPTVKEPPGTILACMMNGKGIKVFEITENHAITDLSAARGRYQKRRFEPDLEIDSNYQRVRDTHLIP
jgi:hypothetical protein